MNDKIKVRVGMVGYQFMAKAHSHAYREIPFFFDTKAVPVLQAISGRNEQKLRSAAEKMGWSSCETDWRRLIERKDIDLIDISAPNHLHAEIAIAALEAGKHVICEKPLAMNLQEASRMLQAAKRSGKVHMICHNYRFAPAVQFAKRLIEEGKIGRIYHIRATYLQDWNTDPDSPLTWRMKKEISGSGAHGDLAAHLIDLARFLVGEFREVVGTLETFIAERPVSKHSQVKGKVDVDDASVFIARFANGAIGTFEATRFANGNRNGNRFEINGEKGSIRWDLENMNLLQIYFADDGPGMQGFRTINCTEAHHPYAGAYWPPGHIIGYEHTFINLMHNLMNGIADGNNPAPDFEDGFRNQQVLDAVERSAVTRSWVSIDETGIRA